MAYKWEEEEEEEEEDAGRGETPPPCNMLGLTNAFAVCPTNAAKRPDATRAFMDSMLISSRERSLLLGGVGGLWRVGLRWVCWLASQQ